ncbi:uncharacterized protein LOC122065490 [Macadamia integrifolia]|uniref:uncharacterized protein LOC122065490 n=1 Tax=Macadamia integrifolia TaxID=60698 RepID=UPI001C4E4CE7|nr:uncharacterized protein LOC122065490 [Macadamia integrifolia]
MASHSLQLLSHTKPHLHLRWNHQITQIVNPSLQPIHNVVRQKPFSTQCASNSISVPETDNPNPNSDSNTGGEAEEGFQIEKRRKSVIIRDRKSRVGLVKPEPKNFEIGWKRTKNIELEKPKGYVIADVLEKLEFLMGREYGSEELLAKTGEIVAERAREEAEILREEGEVEERLITELFRVLKLMEMDLAMVKAAVKEETLKERLEQAKARCRQAILVAYSF